MVCRGISTKGTAYRATLDGNPVLMTGPNDTRVSEGAVPGTNKTRRFLGRYGEGFCTTPHTSIVVDGLLW